MIRCFCVNFFFNRPCRYRQGLLGETSSRSNPTERICMSTILLAPAFTTYHPASHRYAIVSIMNDVAPNMIKYFDFTMHPSVASCHSRIYRRNLGKFNGLGQTFFLAETLVQGMVHRRTARDNFGREATRAPIALSPRSALCNGAPWFRGNLTTITVSVTVEPS
jgi:hypothetical protein